MQTGCHFVSGGWVCPPPTSPQTKGPVAISAPVPTNTSAWGATPATIQANFAHNIYLNVSANPSLDASIKSMDNLMLARLSTELAANDPSGYTPSILAVAAAQVSAATLVRMRSAFGPSVDTAVAANAPGAVKSAYFATPQAAALTISQNSYSLGQARMPEGGAMYGFDVLLLAATQAGNTSNATALATTLRYLHNSVPAASNGVMVVQTADGKSGTLPGCSCNAITDAFCSIVAILTLIDPDYPQQTQAVMDWIQNTWTTWWNSPGQLGNPPIVSCLVADCPPPFVPIYPPLAVYSSWEDIPFAENDGTFDLGGRYAFAEPD
jgi:hypothetical protein